MRPSRKKGCPSLFLYDVRQLDVNLAPKCNFKCEHVTLIICTHSRVCSIILPWTKKRTILEIRGEKNAVPRVISCSITCDKRRAKVADSRGSDLAQRRSLVIEHDITRGTAFFSPRISRMVLFFVQGSTLESGTTEFEVTCFWKTHLWQKFINTLWVYGDHCVAWKSKSYCM